MNSQNFLIRRHFSMFRLENDKFLVLGGTETKIQVFDLENLTFSDNPKLKLTNLDYTQCLSPILF